MQFGRKPRPRFPSYIFCPLNLICVKSVAYYREIVTKAQPIGLQPCAIDLRRLCCWRFAWPYDLDLRPFHVGRPPVSRSPSSVRELIANVHPSILELWRHQSHPLWRYQLQTLRMLRVAWLRIILNREKKSDIDVWLLWFGVIMCRDVFTLTGFHEQFYF